MRMDRWLWAMVAAGVVVMLAPLAGLFESRAGELFWMAGVLLLLLATTWMMSRLLHGARGVG